MVLGKGALKELFLNKLRLKFSDLRKAEDQFRLEAFPKERECLAALTCTVVLKTPPAADNEVLGRIGKFQQDFSTG